MVPFMHVDILPYIGDGGSILDTTPSFSNVRWSFRIHEKYIYQFSMLHFLHISVTTKI